VDALEDHRPLPGHVWNRVPDKVRREIVDLALDEPTLSPRELAVRFTDTKRYFVSESSVYRLLKAHDLITSPAFIVMKAADEFKDKTTAINQLWQTDFTYLKVTGWGWFYLSTILDDFSRYIVAWKLCTTMKTTDVTDTLNMALKASGCDDVQVLHFVPLSGAEGDPVVSLSQLPHRTQEQRKGEARQLGAMTGFIGSFDVGDAIEAAAKLVITAKTVF
jgi:putative transposase